MFFYFVRKGVINPQRAKRAGGCTKSLPTNPGHEITGPGAVIIGNWYNTESFIVKKNIYIGNILPTRRGTVITGPGAVIIGNWYNTEFHCKKKYI